MLPGKLLYQRARAARAGFLVGVEHQRDPRIVFELQLIENFQHRQRNNDARLVVPYALGHRRARLRCGMAGPPPCPWRTPCPCAPSAAPCLCRSRKSSRRCCRQPRALPGPSSMVAPSFCSSSMAIAPTARRPSASPVPESMLTSRSHSLIAPGCWRSALSRIGLTASDAAATATVPEISAATAMHRNAAHRLPPARSGNAAVKPSREALSTPRSVIRPVTRRAGVTSKP